MVRERSDTGRRTVVVRVDPTRLPELFSQLAPLGEDLSTGLSGLDDATMEALAGFLGHAAEATRRATGSQG
ncbi:MAG: hypothetical protein ACQEVD_13760 [Actinomycetota bacterium]